MRIVVLHNDVSGDASSADLDVLAQRDAVLEALGMLGHDARAWSCTLDLSRTYEQLDAERPDAVFNLVEALGGTDRLMPVATLLLDALRLPYTGVPTPGLLMTNGKLSTKQCLRRAALPTAPWLTDAADAWQGLPWPNAGASTREAGDPTPRLAPVIIKAIWEHASFHMGDEAIVSPRTQAELVAILQSRQRETGQPHFAEPYLEGREFNLSLLAGEHGPQVLPPAEIDFGQFPPGKPRIVGYRAKWDETSFDYHHTPRRFDFPLTDQPLLDELCRLAVACWEEFGLRGYARVDFRVDHHGRPWILEVNSNPCLSRDAGFAAAAERAGIRYDQLIHHILLDALASARDSIAPGLSARQGRAGQDRAGDGHA